MVDERPGCSCPQEDRKGARINLHDRVSQPVYPRGTMRGCVVLSERFTCGKCHGRVFAVRELDTGVVYGLSGKALRLKD